jgi:hypothetical protein
MNPDTGQMVALAEGQAAPSGWPVFSIGQELMLQGYKFVITRINRSSIVLKPAVALEPGFVQMARLVDLPPVGSSRRKKKGRRRHH